MIKNSKIQPIKVVLAHGLMNFAPLKKIIKILKNNYDKNR
jgi:hypothetical protein